MKTKTRTLIGLVALGIILFANNHAIAANHEMHMVVTVDREENLAIEAWMLDTNLWNQSSEAKAEKVETEKALEVESWMTEVDFFKAAKSYTSAGSDKEIEKYATRQIALENEREGK